LGKSFGRWYRLAFVLLALYMILPILYILIAIPGKLLYIIPFPWSRVIAGGRTMALFAILLALNQTGFSQFWALPCSKKLIKPRKIILLRTDSIVTCEILYSFLAHFFFGSHL
jgi:hypothetical protein